LCGVAGHEHKGEFTVAVFRPTRELTIRNASYKTSLASSMPAVVSSRPEDANDYSDRTRFGFDVSTVDGDYQCDLMSQ
jgi:hypothetical protein